MSTDPCGISSRMLKKSVSGVLASLRGSTRIFQNSEVLEGLFRSPRPIARANGPTKCGPYLLASSLAAALPDGLFEHHASCSCVNATRKNTAGFERKLSFRSLLGLTCMLPNEQRIEVPESVVLWSQGQAGARVHLAIKPHARAWFQRDDNRLMWEPAERNV